MAKRNCLFFVLVMCLLRNVLGDFLCEAEFCRDQECAAVAPECNINNATHSGLSLPSPTTCNCCDYCLPFIVEGAACSVGGPGLGTNIGRCGHGLTCIQGENGNNYCGRMDTDCHRAQDNYDARHLMGETGALEERPECDSKGLYAAVSCIPTQTCFCQSERGERIFGQIPYSGATVKQGMHCGCSRFHEKIKKTISPGTRYPVIGPRCTADGNYNPIQCIDNDCFCVDRMTGVIREGEGRKISLLEEPITKLQCYDPQFDLFPHQSVGTPPFNYTTLCLENIKDRMELLIESEEAGYNVNHASDFPECLPDGTFGRIVATKNRSKICVDDRREPIGTYEAFRNTPEYDTMDCKCAQTELLMASSLERPVCCKNGNFRKIQCRRDLCRCVDSDGRQVGQGSEVVSDLDCYTPDWKIC